MGTIQDTMHTIENILMETHIIIGKKRPKSDSKHYTAFECIFEGFEQNQPIKIIWFEFVLIKVELNVVYILQ